MATNRQRPPPAQSSAQSCPKTSCVLVNLLGRSPEQTAAIPQEVLCLLDTKEQQLSYLPARELLRPVPLQREHFESASLAFGPIQTERPRDAVGEFNAQSHPSYR